MNKCVKKRYYYSTFYLKCNCGLNMSFDMLYWDHIKYCPRCRQKVSEYVKPKREKCVECDTLIEEPFGLCKDCSERAGRIKEEYVAEIMEMLNDKK